MKRKNVLVVLVLFLGIMLFSCRKDYTPKPYGYFRIYLPAHSYQVLEAKVPFGFEYSAVARIEPRIAPHEKYWFDLLYPQFNAAVHVSYKPINGNLRELTEDARRFVYKHSVKADNITERAFADPEKNVYGVLYDLQGNTASNLQFVITDSTRHFIRGALYFDNVPNKDSIAPVAEYVRQDIIRLMETFRWK